MEIKGDKLIKSSPEKVWAALNDHEVLARCTPGCQLLEPTGDSTYRVILELGVAVVKGKYEGEVRITDIVPNSSYKVSIDGNGVLGFMKGEGTISIEPVEADTRVSYQIEARIGGNLAGVGQRVMGGIAKMLAGKFFSALESGLK